MNKTDKLNSLISIIETCHKCDIAWNRHNIVFGEGNLDSKVVFIGEGPGEDEDLSGRPFVGRSGRLLTDLMGKARIKRKDVYIANIVKCRPPSNRTPEEKEALNCIAYLKRQIEIIDPLVLATLGSTAFRFVANRNDKFSMRSVLGKWFEVNFCGNKKFHVIPFYHPSYLLRKHDEVLENSTIENLKKIMEFVQNHTEEKNNEVYV